MAAGPPYLVDGLLEWAMTAPDPEGRLDEGLMSQPDYAVGALVCGLYLARRLGQPTVYSLVRRTEVPAALHWPTGITEVSCPDLRLGPAPLAPGDEQVIRITSEDELDRLVADLIRRFAQLDDVTAYCLYRTLEEAGRNALEWSAEHAAYVAWGERRGRFELAIGDAGPGIATTSGVDTSAQLATAQLVSSFEEGRASNGLTRMHEHWRLEVPHIEAYITSGAEDHTFMRWIETFRVVRWGSGPTIIWARF